MIKINLLRPKYHIKPLPIYIQHIVVDWAMDYKPTESEILANIEREKRCKWTVVEFPRGLNKTHTSLMRKIYERLWNITEN